MPARIPLLGVHHAAIICSDYERSKRFYVGALGLEVVSEVYREPRRSYKLDLKLPDGTQVELFSFPDPPKRPSYPEACGLRHPAFAVADLDAAVAHLQKHGVAVEPATIDWQNATPGNFRYTLRQPPGPDNALGRIKFIFPNQHSIFLHDTPSRELFSADQRTFSSGCIRVEHPLDLAAVLLEGQDNWTPSRIREAVDSTVQQTVFLKTPVPVLIVYWTVSVGASGELRFAKGPASLAGLVGPLPAPFPWREVAMVVVAAGVFAGGANVLVRVWLMRWSGSINSAVAASGA